MAVYTFTPINVTGKLSLLHGVNNEGEEVGTNYTDSDGNYGLIDDNGKISTFQIQGKAGALDTSANGVNDSGEIVGYFSNGSGNTRGFTYIDGKQRALYYQGSTATYALGVNNAGTVVGSYGSADGSTEGFIESDGQYTSVKIGASKQTQLQGINNSGEMVGFWQASNGKFYGFIDDNGKITGLAHAHAQNTFLFGVNDQGDILGSWTDKQGASHDFIYEDGKFKNITTASGSTQPAAILGINNSNTLVGFNGSQGVIGTTGRTAPANADLSHALFDAAFGQSSVANESHDIHSAAATGSLAAAGDASHVAHFLKG